MEIKKVFFHFDFNVYLATTKSMTETKKYDTPIHNHREPLKGARKANNVGGTFSGALYKIEIPEEVHKLPDNITKLYI